MDNSYVFVLELKTLWLTLKDVVAARTVLVNIQVFVVVYVNFWLTSDIL